MARIAESEIERLKQEISIQRLAEGMGIVLKPCNQELRGLVLSTKTMIPRYLSIR